LKNVFLIFQRRAEELAGAGEAITELLVQVGQGRRSAAEQLMPLVYDQLRALARSFFAVQRPNHTLEPTALVHEAFVRLVGQSQTDWTGRAHFFAVAAKAMRQILINHAEAKQAAKRGGGWQRISVSEAVTESGDREVDLLALNEALSSLEEMDERQARVVELRFFGGLTVEEAAEVLKVAPRTIELDWRMAKAWLVRQLGEK